MSAPALKKKISSFNDEFDFKRFFYILKKNLMWLFFFLTLCTVTSYIYLRYTAPIYEANTVVKVEIENTANKVLNIETQFYDQGTNQIAGQIELIKSKIIIDKAIKSLPLQISYFTKGTVLINELYKSSPFQVEVVLKDSSFLGTPFFIEFNSQREVLIKYSRNGKKHQARLTSDQWTRLAFADFKIHIIDLKSILEQQDKIKQNPYFFTIMDDNVLRKIYTNELTVSLLNQEANTIQINIKDKNALKATDLANAIANEFIKYNYDFKSEGANKILSFITNQLDTVNGDLQNSESMIENFKKNNKLSDPHTQSSLLLTKINDFESQKLLLKLRESLLDKIEKIAIGDKQLEVLLPVLASEFKDGVISELIN